MARRIESTHAWLVAETDGVLAGFAYGGSHRARAAYRWATEVSVYVHPQHRRRGVGRALYGELLPLLARRGLQVALAGITLPNPGSVALHEAIGFQPVGVYRRIGWKAGRLARCRLVAARARRRCSPGKSWVPPSAAQVLASAAAPASGRRRRPGGRAVQRRAAPRASSMIG